jgi:hypothetical protein
VGVLTSEGKMREAGLRSHSHRREDKSKIYSYEQKMAAKLEPADEARFRKAMTAWKEQRRL